MYFNIVDRTILGGAGEASVRAVQQGNDASHSTLESPVPSSISSFAILLGRHSSCTFILSDPDKLLSRRHCLISQISGKYYLNDCGSLNKTVLNGKVVQFEMLRTGDVIVFAAGMNAQTRSSLDIPFDEDFIENVRKLSEKCIIYEVNLEWGDGMGPGGAFDMLSHTTSPTASSTMCGAPVVGEKRKRNSVDNNNAAESHPTKRRKLEDQASTPTHELTRQKKHLEDKLKYTETRLSFILDKLSGSFDKISNMEDQTHAQKNEIEKLEERNGVLENALRDTQEAKSIMQRNLKALQDKFRAMGERATPEQLKQQINDIVEQEMTCSICQHVFVDPVTLGCSHSYCKGCLLSWIHSKSDNCEACLCPLCRVHIGYHAPMRNVVLESLIEKILNFLGHSEIEHSIKRVNEMKEYEKQAEAQLDQLITLAKKNATNFMNINEEWSDEAKKIFLKGVRSYAGTARAKYCELVGMDETWIQTASLKQMRIACKNLGMREPYRRSPKDPTVLQLFEDDLRRVLHEYTKNELLSQIPFLSV